MNEPTKERPMTPIERLMVTSTLRRHRRCLGAAQRVCHYRFRVGVRARSSLPAIDAFMAQIRRTLDHERLGRVIRAAFPPDGPIVAG